MVNGRVTAKGPKKTAAALREEELHDTILAEELSAVHGELGRIDAKSSMLLGLAAGSLLLATATPMTGPGSWLVKAGMGLAAASLIPLLAVVKPRLGTTGFPRHARLTAAQIRDELIGVDPRSWRSTQLWALSRIAVRKFRLLKAAVVFQIAALVVAGVGAIILVV